MPPSRHSSSHHSSHRSSSHHSSHHSSSFRSSSGPSYRSSSHHSSGSSFGGGFGSGGFGGGYHRHYRRNGGLFSFLVNGSRGDDYEYNPNDYSLSGEESEETPSGPQTTTTQQMQLFYVCDYCETTLPCFQANTDNTCPNCGATMRTVERTVAVTKKVEETPKSTGAVETGSSTAEGSGKKGGSGRRIILWVVAIYAISQLFSGVTGIFHDRANSNSNNYSYSSGYTSTSGSGNTISVIDDDNIFTSQTNSMYVAELGRNVSWNNEYDSYYDPGTDCYFVSSDGIWQYWFEGISSDFGDYGWMEYDYDENAWYIEKSNGNWIPLPSKYNSSNLWHFE
ncbi:MAG: hypothetical protein KBT01_00310 [Clostridiales bacterium]|nr:hypothetical protein [Candidatus Blautia equi]